MRSVFPITYFGRSFLVVCYCLGFIACTDPISSNDNYEINFNTPTDLAQLTCAQDQNRDTRMFIETDVALTIEFPSAKQSDLIVVLQSYVGQSDETSFPEQRSTVNSTGRVLFEALAFESNSHRLSAQLFEGAELRAETQIEIEVLIDPSDIRCTQTESRLVIRTLQDQQQLSANDDLDRDLTNGVQIAVTVDVEGPIINDLLEIRVNDEAQGRIRSENGVATFDSVSLGLDQSSTISVLAQGPEGIIDANVTVNVEATRCELTVSPLAMEGCDISSALDVRPDEEGLQVELTAQTDCAQVLWTVNGEVLDPVEVVEGSATVVVDMVEGENTVNVQAESENGLSADLPTYILDAILTDPQIDFEGVVLMGENRRGLMEANLGSVDTATQSAEWQFVGFTAEVAVGSTVTLNYNPSLPNAPTSAIIDANGRFAFNISSQFNCGHEIQADVYDECGGLHQSPIYTLCLDAVSPVITIIDPSSDALLTRGLDTDTETNGLQIEFMLAINDPRIGVDYPIDLQCSTQDDPTFVTLSQESLLRSQMESDLEDPSVYTGKIIATFNQASQYTCRAFANTGINPAVIPTQTFRVITDEPTFTILDPSFNNTGEACIAQGLFIGGRGSQLSPADTELRFTIRSSSGQIIRQGTLELIEGADFGINIPVGPQGLVDGVYELEITGESSSIPIAMIPLEPITLQVDRTPPELALIAPSGSQLDSTQDANNDLSDCIQTPLQISLNDQSATQICYTLNQSQARCADVNDMGILNTEELNFIPGENNLTLSVLDCTGEAQNLEIVLNTVGCGDPLRIVAPGDGTSLSLADDESDEQMGWQITTNVSGTPNEVVNIDVLGGVNPLSFGPITLDANGLGSFLLTLPPPEDEEQTLSLEISSALRTGWSHEVTLLNVVPTINLDPIVAEGRCVNLNIDDRSAQTGFQLDFKASAEGIRLDQPPVLTVSCPEYNISKIGRITDLGGNAARIDFDAVTLVDEGECTARVTAFDGRQQVVEHSLNFIIDRIAPQVSLISPSLSLLTLLDDQDSSQAGIQSSITLNVCGAPEQNLFLSVTPAQNNLEQMLSVEQGECAEVQSELLNFDLGTYAINASVSDACGNQQDYVQNLEIDTGVALSIVDPSDQSTISILQDADSLTQGCQFEIQATSTGFASIDQLNFKICSDTQEGEADSLCANAVNVSADECEIFDPEARAVVCQVSLSDALHQLTLVAEQNGTIIESESIAVYSDCTAPSIELMQVQEDEDRNGCINRQERSNSGSNGVNATFNVSFRVSGLSDGTIINLRALPGERLLSQAIVNDNEGTFIGANLSPGEHLLYLSGLDEAQNPLPTINSDNFSPMQIRVDTSVPTPSVVFPQQNSCLGINDDQSLTLNTLQFNPSMNTGADIEETITATLSIDGFPEQTVVGTQSILTFTEQSLAEGDHNLIMQARDNCGNIGSVAGFVNVGGQEDWSQPLDFSIRVDLSAPQLTLEGVVEDQVFTPETDANQNSTDGFQLNVNLRAEGFEAGQELLVFSGEQRLITLPAQILVGIQGLDVIPVQLTLPPGPHALNIRGADTCENTNVSEVVNIQVNIDGCSSRILSVSQNDILGPNSGARVEEGLRIDIGGSVDLLDLSCSDAQVELWSRQDLTNTLLASTSLDPSNGAVVFEQVTLPEGTLDLFIRTRLDNNITDSLSRTVSVDITAPIVSVTQPFVDNEGVAYLLSDEDVNTAGQQFTLIAQINEDPVTTARIAEISSNDQVVRSDITVNANTVNSELRIENLQATPGISNYQLCVQDLAGNEGCKSWSLDSDPSAPSIVVANIQILNKRKAEIQASFLASSDDDLGTASVQAYEIRWSLGPLNEEFEWESAQVMNERIAVATPNSNESFIISDLPPNDLFNLAIRARDDAGRLSPLNAVSIDTRLDSHEVEFMTNDNQAPTWSISSLNLTNTNPIQSLTDVNQDGFDDLLVVGAQSGQNAENKSGAMLILGAGDLSNTRSITLTPPNNFTTILFGSGGAALGDINGDSSPDFAVLGFLGDFSGAGVALYFGCPDAENCTDQDLSTADVVINIPGALRNSVNSIGDVAQLQGAGFNDIIIGGGVDVPNTNYADPRAALVIEGRETWPATIDGSVANQNLGVYLLDPQINNMGIYAGGLGDINQDGIDDLAMAGGGNLDQLFVIYGGVAFDNNLQDGVWTYDENDSNFVQLENPCPVGASNFGTFIKGGYDLDGDNVNDFIVGNRANKSLVVIKNDLSLIECFSRSEDLFGIYFDLVGDINEDGTQDLIATHDDLGNTLAFVFYNDGNGVFGKINQSNARQPSMYLREPAARKVAVSAGGDMNNDGKDDFVTMSYEEVSQLFVISIFY